jgi:glycosyltransferase involved in cell wall biosynthesis
MNCDGKFVVGMNFMNNDRWRKNIVPAMRGFAMFHAKHPDSVLAIHAIEALKDGHVIPRVAAHLGILDAIAMSPQYELVCGMITPRMLADWYGALDVLVNIGNEGFGLPAVEAQACGVPVILGDWTTGPDLVGDGWLVSGEPVWNEKHRADWYLAHASSVADALEEAYDQAQDETAAGIGRSNARDNALSHEIGRVVREYWEPVLGDLG